MRVLLDESVPRPLADLLTGHDVATVGQRGCAGIHNGELLQRASGEFDVSVTVDKNLPHQQDLQRHSVVVVILDAPTNRASDLEPLVPQLLQALAEPLTSPTFIGESRG